MDNFKKHLQNQGLKERTVKEKVVLLIKAGEWLKDQGINLETAHYNDLLKYAHYCKSKGNIAITVNQKIYALAGDLLLWWGRQ